MTREIKFRIFDTINKEMYKDINPFQIFKKENAFATISHEFILEGWMKTPEKNEIVVMQFTGLKDKNGKEIYEGDIIKTDDETVEVKQLELFECDAFVVYGYLFCSNHFIENYRKVGLDRFYSCNPEIIGNIYENPELLTD